MSVSAPRGVQSTREKIKAAAGEIFAQKGYAAARMQEIADRAGANKASIYYYFSSKDALFEAIIRESFAELVANLSVLFELREPEPKKLIKRLVHVHLQFLLEHPQLPRLLVRELNSDNPLPQKVLADVMGQFSRQRISRLQQLFDRAVAARTARQMDVRQLILSIVSLNVFSFIAWPVLQIIWPAENRRFDKAMRDREKAVVDLILNGMMPR